MSIRTTIMLDENLAKRIRILQATLIKEKNHSVSFSKVVNDLVRRGLKDRG